MGAVLSTYCAQSFSTLPPPPEVGGLAFPMTARRSSAATLSPALTRTRSTMPVAEAGMTVSIFIDESTCEEGRNHAYSETRRIRQSRTLSTAP